MIAADRAVWDSVVKSILARQPRPSRVWVTKKDLAAIVRAGAAHPEAAFRNETPPARPILAGAELWELK